MFLSIQASAAGWWAGVLHPMRSPGVLISLLLVGLLGGLAVRAWRSSWTLPAAFIAALLVFGLIAVAADRSFHLPAAVIAVCVLMAALLFVHPRRTGVIATLAVLASGALVGVADSVDDAGDARSLGYAAGFVFTSSMLLSVVDIVGASIGRSLRARQPVPPGAQPSPVDDPALV